MLKKLLAGKSIFSSLIALIGTILLMAAVGFAWWSISNQAGTDDIVNTVGEIDTSFSLKQFIDGDLSGPLTTTSEVNFENAIPGDTYSFVLIIENTGNIDGHVSAYLYDVISEGYDEVNGWTELGAEVTKRIQNSFNYEVLSITYLTATDDVTLETMYSNLTAGINKIYFTAETDRYFMAESETLDIDGNNSTLAIFFNVSYEGAGFDNNDYIGQRFDINKIVIECK